MALRDDIAALYDTLLKRPADTPGVNYWENVIQSGQASLDDVRNLIANSAEAKGLLGGGTTGGTSGAATGGATGGLLSNAINAGIPRDQAVSLITGAYRNYFDRTPDQAGLDYWANLLTSGQQTWPEVLANIQRSTEAGTPASQAAQAGIRQVQFGQQPIMGQVRDVAQYNAPRNLPPSIQDAFQQSLAYQAALPYLIPQFNPADIPATYQQIAQPRQRLDIANVQVPDWLRIAAAKDEKRADAETAALSGGTTGRTGGITSTTPGTIGGGATGGTTGGRSAADLQAFQTLLGQTYQTALGRPVETAGANYWTGMYTSGTPFQTIVNAIMNSPEAQARSGGGLLSTGE